MANQHVIGTNGLTRNEVNGYFIDKTNSKHGNESGGQANSRSAMLCKENQPTNRQNESIRCGSDEMDCKENVFKPIEVNSDQAYQQQQQPSFHHHQPQQPKSDLKRSVSQSLQSSATNCLGSAQTNDEEDDDEDDDGTHCNEENETLRLSFKAKLHAFENLAKVESKRPELLRAGAVKNKLRLSCSTSQLLSSKSSENLLHNALDTNSNGKRNNLTNKTFGSNKIAYSSMGNIKQFNERSETIQKCSEPTANVHQISGNCNDTTALKANTLFDQKIDRNELSNSKLNQTDNCKVSTNECQSSSPQDSQMQLSASPPQSALLYEDTIVDDPMKGLTHRRGGFKLNTYNGSQSIGTSYDSSDAIAADESTSTAHSNNYAYYNCPKPYTLVNGTGSNSSGQMDCGSNTALNTSGQVSSPDSGYVNPSPGAGHYSSTVPTNLAITMRTSLNLQSATPPYNYNHWLIQEAELRRQMASQNSATSMNSSVDPNNLTAASVHSVSQSHSQSAPSSVSGQHHHHQQITQQQQQILAPPQPPQPKSIPPLSVSQQPNNSRLQYPPPHSQSLQSPAQQSFISKHQHSMHSTNGSLVQLNNNHNMVPNNNHAAGTVYRDDQPVYENAIIYNAHKSQMMHQQSQSLAQQHLSQLPASSQLPPQNSVLQPPTFSKPPYPNPPVSSHQLSTQYSQTQPKAPAKQQKQILSVSGKKKCSNCGDELGNLNKIS